MFEKVNVSLLGLNDSDHKDDNLNSAELGLLENPQKSLEYLEQLEKLGEDITRDRQEIVAIDRRRNQNREALRALRQQTGKTWITLGSLLVKVQVEKAAELLERGNYSMTPVYHHHAWHDSPLWTLAFLRFLYLLLDSPSF